MSNNTIGGPAQTGYTGVPNIKAPQGHSASGLPSANATPSAMIPPITIDIDGYSDTLCDLKYLRKMEQVMKTHCNLINMESLKEAFDMSPKVPGVPDRIMGLSLHDLQSYAIQIDNPAALICEMGQGENRNEWNELIAKACSAYIMHALMTVKILPCLWNGDVSALLFNRVTTSDPLKPGGINNVAIVVKPIRFIEMPVEIPHDEAGRYNIQSANEAILATEYS